MTVNMKNGRSKGSTTVSPSVTLTLQSAKRVGKKLIGFDKTKLGYATGGQNNPPIIMT